MNLEFVVVGLLASLCYAVGIVLKKYIFIQTDIPDYAFTVFETSIHTLVGIALVLALGVSLFTNTYVISILFFAGVIYGVSLVLYYYAVNKDDASRVTQLASLETVITPIFAILLLGESPSAQALSGAILIIIALLILTIEKNVVNMLYTAKVALIPIGLSLIIWGFQDVLIKYSLDYIDYIFAYFWLRTASFVSLTLIFSVRSQNRKQLRRIQTDLSSKFQWIFSISAVISALGLLFAVYAYSLGPLSIASPIVSSYPLFVLVCVYVGYRVFGVELESRGSLPKRIISGILFLCGITLVAM